jgi:translation initiation factor 1
MPKERVVWREFGDSAEPERPTSKSVNLPPQQQVACVSQDRKGRGGKTVTLISGLALNDETLKILAKELKAHCGSGGTHKEGVIEIQGEHRDKVMEFLKSRGYGVKRVGG